MSSKIIIIATIVLLLASFATLFVVEVKNHNYDYKKSWSVVYFKNPQDDSLDFVVENHEGLDGNYGYKIFVNDNKVVDGDVDIPAGAKQEISPVLDGKKIKGARVTINVSYKNTDYNIYKDLAE